MGAMHGCVYSSRACSSHKVVHPVAVPNRSRCLRGKWVATPHTNRYFNRCIDLCESSDALQRGPVWEESATHKTALLR